MSRINDYFQIRKVVDNMNVKLYLKIENELEAKTGISMASVVGALNSKPNIHSGITTIGVLYNNLNLEACGISHCGIHFSHNMKDAKKMLKVVKPIMKTANSVNDVYLVCVLGYCFGIKNINVLPITSKSFVDIIRKYLYVSASQIEHNIKHIIKQQQYTPQGLRNALQLSYNYSAIKQAVPNNALFLNYFNNRISDADVMNIKQASNLDEHKLDAVSDIVFNNISKQTSR